MRAKDGTLASASWNTANHRRRTYCTVRCRPISPPEAVYLSSGKISYHFSIISSAAKGHCTSHCRSSIRNTSPLPPPSLPCTRSQCILCDIIFRQHKFPLTNVRHRESERRDVATGVPRLAKRSLAEVTLGVEARDGCRRHMLWWKRWRTHGMRCGCRCRGVGSSTGAVCSTLANADLEARAHGAVGLLL